MGLFFLKHWYINDLINVLKLAQINIGLFYIIDGHGSKLLDDQNRVENSKCDFIKTLSWTRFFPTIKDMNNDRLKIILSQIIIDGRSALRRLA